MHKHKWRKYKTTRYTQYSGAVNDYRCECGRWKQTVEICKRNTGTNTIIIVAIVSKYANGLLDYIPAQVVRRNNL